MNSVEEFFRYSLLENAEHDDEYHDNLEMIAGNDIYLNDFQHVLKNSIELLNRRKILVVVSMLKELISYQANLGVLYPIILELMYKNTSYDWSISPRFVQILVKIKGENITVFKDITESTDANNTINVGISVCSLYSNYPNFEGIPEAIVNKFLKKTYVCLRNNQNCDKLKQAILTNLLPILQNKNYMGYYEKLSNEGLSLIK